MQLQLPILLTTLATAVLAAPVPTPFPADGPGPIQESHFRCMKRKFPGYGEGQAGTAEEYFKCRNRMADTWIWDEEKEKLQPIGDWTQEHGL